jgi:hypothetical protein
MATKLKFLFFSKKKKPGVDSATPEPTLGAQGGGRNHPQWGTKGVTKFSFLLFSFFFFFFFLKKKCFF